MLSTNRFTHLRSDAIQKLTVKRRTEKHDEFENAEDESIFGRSRTLPLGFLWEKRSLKVIKKGLRIGRWTRMPIIYLKADTNGITKVS